MASCLKTYTEFFHASDLTILCRPQMVLDENNKIDYLAIGMGENEYNVADSSVVANLPKEARLKAAQNVLAMQAQLEAMLATLQAGA